MSYTAQNVQGFQRAVSAEQATWYFVSDLWALTRELRPLNFAIAASRAEALAKINALTARQPFALGDIGEDVNITARRFSAALATPGIPRPAQIYVLASSDAWEKVFQQVISALSFANRQHEVSQVQSIIPGSTTVAGGDPNMFSRAFNDASQAYMNGVTTMIQMLGKNISVYGCPTFEVEFELLWA